MNRIFWLIIACLMAGFGVSIAMDQGNAPADGIISRQDFENSICFKKCHQPHQFLARDKSRVQWENLIENDGHAIFAKIPWESELQKQQIVDYLRENAKGFMTEGIGIWR